MVCSSLKQAACFTLYCELCMTTYRYASHNDGNTFLEMRRCAKVTECTYTNLDSIAYYTPSLYIACCS